VRLLPMTDAEVETHVVVEEPPGTVVSLHFEEWWVRTRATLPAIRFEQPGVEAARPAPGVLEAIAAADVLLLAPSNPVVSVGTILGVPGIREALAETSARVVGVSPIIGGGAVRGMAEACLRAIGVATSAEAVGRHYGARRDGGLLDAWLVDPVDASAVEPLAAAGLRTVAEPLYLTDERESARIAAAALRLATR
jgi:LPPG:FO 2-phospho-L-lactate transferase